MIPSDNGIPLTAAVGTFDGVHRGHMAVLDEVRRIAAGTRTSPAVFTFDRHPLEEIAPQRAPLAITTIEKKCELIRAAGVTPIVLPFDSALRATTARQWIERLSREYGVTHLVAGYDNTFGSDGVSLSLADYREIARDFGMDVTEAPVVAGISSSAVRKAIAAGEVERAREMLGRRFLLPGTVVEGNKLGRTIGFPTANLLSAPGLIVPANGVYAVRAHLPDGFILPAVVNIGVRPTVMRGNTKTIEAHIIGWKGDLYGKPLKLAFQNRIREEQRFPSIDALRHQIEKDCKEAKILLSENIPLQK